MKRMFWSLRNEPDQSNVRHVKEAKPATTEAFPMNGIRRYKLKEIIYPSIILAIAAVEGSDNALRRSEKEAIPELMRFNIVENDIRDVA